MPMRRCTQYGVTLLELMTVMGVVAILAAVAIPSYRQYIIRTNRTSAKTALTQTAQMLERCFTRLNAYDNGGCAVVMPFTTPDGIYRITGAVTPTTYMLTATPLGRQTADTQCADLTLNQAGQQDTSGTLPATECWPR
jgi:type IV pilus assembly protein PilE